MDVLYLAAMAAIRGSAYRNQSVISSSDKQIKCVILQVSGCHASGNGNSVGGRLNVILPSVILLVTAD